MALIMGTETVILAWTVIITSSCAAVAVICAATPPPSFLTSPQSSPPLLLSLTCGSMGSFLTLLHGVTSSRRFVESIVFSVVVSRIYDFVLIFSIKILDNNNKIVLLSPKMRL